MKDSLGTKEISFLADELEATAVEIVGVKSDNVSVYCQFSGFKAENGPKQAKKKLTTFDLLNLHLNRMRSD